MFVRLTVSPGSPGDEFRPRVVEDASTPFVGGKVYDIDASSSEVKFPAGYLQRFREVGISVVSVTDTKGNRYEPHEGIHIQFEKSSGVGSDPLADPHFALYYRYRSRPVRRSDRTSLDRDYGTATAARDLSPDTDAK